MSNIKTAPILIFDFETGGLDCKTHGITEFAGIAINGETFEEIGRYEALLAPYSSELLYDPEALKATNITMQMIKGGMDFKVFTREFLSFLKKVNLFTHPKYRLLMCGHNVKFDIGFMQQLFYYMGKKIEDYFSCDSDFYGNQQPSYLDTQKLAMVRWGDDETMVKHTLSVCMAKINEEIINAHRAMNDVVATKTLLLSFLKSLRNKNTTVQEVVEEARFRETFKF